MLKGKVVIKAKDKTEALMYEM